MVWPVSDPPLRLAELVGCLSLATDMAMGHPMEQGLGACMVATRLAELSRLSAEEIARAYYLALLRHIGCTTERDGLAAMVGDEIALGASLDSLSGAKATEFMAAFFRFVTADKGPAGKAKAVARLIGGMREFEATNRAICEVAQMLASRLGFDPPLPSEIAAVYERWDGKGMPNKVAGDRIPIPIRVTQIADLAAGIHDLGLGDPAAVVRSRSGTGFDPHLAEVFVRHAPELLAELEAPSRWDAVMAMEPGSGRLLTGEARDHALRAVAEFADLQSTYLVGHSSGVSDLARAAAGRLRLPSQDIDDVGGAGLVHDLGRIGVSAGTWSKRGPLTAGEWEAVRLHPYHTERVLNRAPSLARLAAVASAHHERMDGSGYFRGTASTHLGPGPRLLAAADAYHAMTEPRPHRPAHPPDRAAEELRAEVRAGRLDRECADAVLEAAGHRVGRRKEYAAGLSPREVEVLRLVARGLPTKAIARELVVSPKTAENHIHSIYGKAGVTTRAAATVFAMQHGLMDTLAD